MYVKRSKAKAPLKTAVSSSTTAAPVAPAVQPNVATTSNGNGPKSNGARRSSANRSARKEMLYQSSG